MNPVLFCKAKIMKPTWALLYTTQLVLVVQWMHSVPDASRVTAFRRFRMRSATHAIRLIGSGYRLDIGRTRAGSTLIDNNSYYVSNDPSARRYIKVHTLTWTSQARITTNPSEYGTADSVFVFIAAMNVSTE
jgi:hypothetical protein